MALKATYFTCVFFYQNNQDSVAMKALEYLSHHSQDFQQTVTALK